MVGIRWTRRQALLSALAGGVAAAANVPFAGVAGAADGKQRLVVGMSGFPSAVEPVLFNATATRRVVPQMFDTLIVVDQNDGTTLRPALAERWERLDDKSLRLFLRKDVVFHDGGAFTADDVVFTFSPDHLLGPGKAGRSVAMQTLERIDHAEAVDAFTVIIHAKGADALLERRLAAWSSEIISKKAFDAAGSWEKWTAAPVGTGPYRLVSQKLDVNVKLAAHDKYWGGKPPYDEIEYRIIPELAARINGLLAGELDIVTDIPPDQFGEIEKRSELEIAGGGVQNIRSLCFDQSDPVLKDARIRRAMSLALDRKLFVETLWDNRLSIPNGFQLPSFGDGYIADFPALAYDPDQARALVKQAGYDGSPITYRLLNNYYPNQVSGAQVMIEMWKAVGLNVSIQMMENFSQIQTKPVHAFYDNSTTASFPDQLGFSWRLLGPAGELPKQVGIWSNDEYFALGAKLQETVDVGERRKLIRRMLEIIDRDDPPCVILHVSGQFYGKKKAVQWLPGQSIDLNFGPSNRALSRT